MQIQSPELTEFYRAYLAWVEGGAQRCNEFSRVTGLCGNLMTYCGATTLHGMCGATTIHGMCEASSILEKEMNEQFVAAGLDTSYPFGGFKVYSHEYLSDTAHLNPTRIKWVRDHANL